MPEEQAPVVESVSYLAMDGYAEVWVRTAGGATISFDAAQLPDHMAEAIGAVNAALTVANADLTATVKAKDADLAAKDANIQLLLEEIERLKTVG